MADGLGESDPAIDWFLASSNSSKSSCSNRRLGLKGLSKSLDAWFNEEVLAD